jgi:hypothetical protein
MKMDLIIRRFAGTFILLSLVLAHYHSRYWLWFTAFVGFNLLQSSFTNFCPLEIILKRWVWVELVVPGSRSNLLSCERTAECSPLAWPVFSGLPPPRFDA